MHISKYLWMVIAACLLMAAGCSSLESALNLRRPTANLQGLKFEDINLSGARLLFDVEVENPYPVALPLTNVDYNLTSRDNSLLTGTSDLQSQVSAKSKTTLTLPAQIKYLDLAKAFKDVRPGSVIPYQADLGLLVSTPALGQLRLPITKNGQLTVPTIPQMSNLDWGKIIDKIK